MCMQAVSDTALKEVPLHCQRYYGIASNTALREVPLHYNAHSFLTVYVSIVFFYAIFYPIETNSRVRRHRQLLDFPNPLGTTNNRHKWMWLNVPILSFHFIHFKLCYRQQLVQYQALSHWSSSQCLECNTLELWPARSAAPIQCLNVLV